MRILGHPDKIQQISMQTNIDVECVLYNIEAVR